MSLWSEFLTNEQRLIHKWKHYFPIYESHFKRFVNRDVVILEIGCGQGGTPKNSHRKLVEVNNGNQ